MDRYASDAAVGDRCPHCGHEVGDSWLMCAWCGEQIAVAAELAPGTRLGGGRYQVLRVIGRGGFGITYEVGDRRLERRVAMKELFPESAVRHGSVVLTPPTGRSAFKAARDRFLREARVLARFTQPGIVRVYEVFEENGTAYLVMELLEGRTLVELLQQRGRPFPEREILDVAGRVAAALRPVHAAAVLHRDVNPSNVMMTEHGRIVVIDFGLARDYDQEETAGMTRVVTPGYAPLEQYRGTGRFGPPTDVYGLAATLYRLATGKVPTSAVERDAGGVLSSVHRLNPSVSKGVSDAILDGLELRPEHRPRDLDSFLARLGIPDLPAGTRSSLVDLVEPPPAPPAAPGDRGSGCPHRPEAGPSPSHVPGLAGAPVRPDPGPRSRPDGPPPGPPRRPPGRPHRPGPIARADGRPDPGHASPPAVDAPIVGATALAMAPVGPAAPAALDDATRLPAAQAAPADVTRLPVPAGPDDVTRLPVAVQPPEPAHGPTERAPDGRGAAPIGPPPDIAYLDRKRSMRGAAHHRSSPSEPEGAPGRRSVTVPLALAALAAGSAAPVAASAVMVLVVVPLLATIGSSSLHRARDRAGVAAHWAEMHMSPGVLAAPRMVGHVLVSILRAIPAALLCGLVVATWHAVDGIDSSRVIGDVVLRGGGAAVVAVILAMAARGSSRLPTRNGIDSMVRAVRPGGRFGERVVIVWLLAAAITAAGLWLAPTAAPFGA